MAQTRRWKYAADPKCLVPTSVKLWFVVGCCPAHHRMWWEWKCPNSQWNVRSNQPVFTSLMDCQTAIGILQDTNPVILDYSQEDKDRGYAVDLFCIAV